MSSVARRPSRKSFQRALIAGISLTALLVVVATPVVAAPRESSHITVDQPVAFGQTTMAHVNPGGTGVYVLTQCYLPDGKYVFAAFSDVDSNNVSVVGPLSSSKWKSGAANCTAQEGSFAKNGRWLVAAQTAFSVQP
jgi:hypothetical protein